MSDDNERVWRFYLDDMIGFAQKISPCDRNDKLARHDLPVA